MTIHLTAAQGKALLRKASPSVTVTEEALKQAKPRNRQKGISESNPDEQITGSHYVPLSSQEASKLQEFSAKLQQCGWMAEPVKSFCSKCDASYWHSKKYNSVVIWRGNVQRSWCLCELVEMSQEEMEQTLLAGETNRQKRRT